MIKISSVLKDDVDDDVHGGVVITLRNVACPGLEVWTGTTHTTKYLCGVPSHNVQY